MNKTINESGKRFQNIFETYTCFPKRDYLIDLFNVISGSGFKNWWNNLFVKSVDSISSLRVYPIQKEYFIGYERNELDTITMLKGTFNVNHIPINPDYTVMHIGHHFFDYAQSFMDLAPHTSVQLYLPYIDFIDLPIDELIGNDLDIYYSVDLATGIVTAYIQVTTRTTSYLMATKSSKLGIDIAWGATNVGEIVKNTLSTIISTAISVIAISATPIKNATAGVVKSVAKGATLAKGVLSIANSQQVQFQRGGASGASNGTVAPSHPYLIIKHDSLADIGDEREYEKKYGKPLYQTRTLSTVRGYTIIDEIHLDLTSEDFNYITEDEVSEIETLLRNGVHF